jgi:hypothetical protein
VFRQTTGPPEFDVAVVPSGRQGMPTAGRVSTPAGVVEVVGDGECGLVVVATVVDGGADEVVGGAVVATVVDGGADQVVGGAVVVANDGVGFGGVVITGAGAVTMGGGMAVAGAVRGGGTLVTEDEISTLGDVSSDSEAERNAMTPNNPPAATAMMVTTSPAMSSRRRWRDAIELSSVAALQASFSANVVASSTSVSGRTSGGATTSPTSVAAGAGAAAAGRGATAAAGGGATVAAGGAGTAAAPAGSGDEGGSVGAPLSVFGTVTSAAAPAFRVDNWLHLASSALAKSRHRSNLSLGAFISARAKGASK